VFGVRAGPFSRRIEAPHANVNRGRLSDHLHFPVWGNHFFSH
jgi:hypothetical protein